MLVREFLLRWYLASWTQDPAVVTAGVSTLLTQAGTAELTADLTPAQRAVAQDGQLAKQAARLAAATRYVTRVDAEYPPRLAEGLKPPLVLFYLGDWAALARPTLGVVGARRASRYTHQALNQLTPAHADWSIISGLANGADTFAHDWALAHGWPTIAVIANGLDVVYPATNRELQARIAAAGLVISEYPLGTPPRPYRFVARNRLIASLAHGVLVTEAAAHSGSLITANFALTANRDVFAVPNRLDAPLGQGTNALIAAGATPVSRPEDLTLRYYP
ncbi:DNA-processing protein DprA [Lacticaseibacillus nasuensis]|nr:DNA-processing protein DprA [Lacticaseibacillus nasuensis]